MSERNDVADEGSDAPVTPRKSSLLIAMAALVFAEAAAVTALVVYLFYELLVERPQSYAGAIAILVLTVVAAVWLVVVAVNTLRGRPWIRAAVVVWQVLQIGVGIGSLQGLLPRDDIGWLLIGPALVVLALLFTRPVIAATTQPGSASE